MHLAGNMLFLWVLGDNVEDALGYRRFAVFYLLSGVAAALAHAATNPASQVPMIGASGAISGVIGAYLMLHPRARIKTLIGYFIVSLPAYVVLGFWIGYQFLSASVAAGGAGGGVAGVILIVPMRQKGVQLFDSGRKKFEFRMGVKKAPRGRSRIPRSSGSGPKGPWG